MMRNLGAASTRREEERGRIEKMHLIQAYKDVYILMYQFRYSNAPIIGTHTYVHTHINVY